LYEGIEIQLDESEPLSLIEFPDKQKNFNKKSRFHLEAGFSYL
jgi:isocitrate dehydrogenase